MFFRCITALVLATAATCVPASAQTSNATLINLQTQARNVDFSNFSFTRPIATGTALPSTCQQGQLFFNTAANAGSNLYACTSSNAWTLQGGGGTVSSVTWGGMPAWLIGTVANGSTAPSLTLGTASGQTAHQVLGTGAGSSFTPMSLTPADLPSSITSNTTGTAANVTGTVAIANGGTGQTSASAAFNGLSPLTTLGDILFGGASGAGSRLPGNTTTTKKFLTQTGLGSASAAPAWGSITAGDLPGSISSSTTGNAATATQLASTPTACAAGLYATSITAMGNANCAQVSYSQVSGTPSLYNQTIQINGTPQIQMTALNFAAGSNVTLSGNSSGGITTLTISGSGSSNGLSGPSTSTNYALPFWNGTSGNALGNSQITTDAAGDVTTGGAVTASSLASSGSGAGTLTLSQGSAQSTFASNSVSIYAPATVASSYQWVLPANDAAGAIVSDGNGTPGHLSITGFEGTGSKIQKTSAGTTTANDLVTWDGNGNTTDGVGGNLQANSSGVLTTIDGTATAGTGVPILVASGNSGPVNTAIASTTILTVPSVAAHLYRISLSITQVDAGAGCTAQSTITMPVISYTNGANSNVQTNVGSYWSSATSASVNSNSTYALEGTPLQDLYTAYSRLLYLKAGSTLSYAALTYTAGGGCTTNPHYEVFYTVEMMQ